MFGCLGWALCHHGRAAFQRGSVPGILDGVRLRIAAGPSGGAGASRNQSDSDGHANALGANSPVISAGMVFSLFRMRQMWMFVLYMIGVACVYDVFDQQFATFFRAFLTRRRRGSAFGFATTAGERFAMPSSCSALDNQPHWCQNTLLCRGSDYDHPHHRVGLCHHGY